MRKNYLLELIIFAAAVFIIFGKSIPYDFLFWDDEAFIPDNPFIKDLSLSNLWIMCQPHFGIVTPVYWLSLSIDYQFFGANPAAYRMINMIFHVINMLLLFYLFNSVVKRGELKQSQFWLAGFIVLMIWGLHPLRVESIVWISQRRDVLCAFFELLCIICYLKSTKRDNNRRLSLLSMLFFVLAILTKPTAVPLPIVLILLDCYPLQKIKPDAGFIQSILRSAYEKSAYFIISILSAVLTIYGHHIYKGLAGTDMFSIEHRIANATYGLAFYIVQSLAPLNLIPFYPRQSLSISDPLILSTFLLYAFIAWQIYKFAREKKTLLPLTIIGIYVAMLLPMLGIFQGGNQGAGDRFSYMSTVPFYFLLGWLLLKYSQKKWLYAIVGTWSLLLISKTIAQQNIWENNISFYRSLTTETEYQVATAYNKLGLELLDVGENDDALQQFLKAIPLPGKDHERAGAANCAGNIYFEKNMLDEAEKYYAKAVQIDDNAYLAHNNLGNVYVKKNQLNDALKAYIKAIEIEDHYAGAYHNLGSLYRSTGNIDKAEQALLKSLQLDPNNTSAKSMLIEIENYKKSQKRN